MKKSFEEVKDTLLKGIVDLHTLSELKERWESKNEFTVKFGADPTSSDLHLGHAVALRKLKQFQEAGAKILFLIGGFTAQIGDPSGKNKLRPPLTKEEVEENAKTYFEQVGLILDLDKVEVKNNADWFEKMSAKDLINLMGKYTVARTIERDDFAKRLKEGVPIYMHEIVYPLLQGYDSVVLKNDLELGGSDQLFNLLVGRQLQKEWEIQPQIVMTVPLLEGLDGKKKMSKSYGNYVGLKDEPADMYGKIMSIPDELMWKYWLLLTDKTEDEIEEMKKKIAEGLNPMQVKHDLAFTITAWLHDTEKAKQAREHFVKVFSKKDIPDDMPEILIEGEEDIVSVIARSGLVKSKSEVRRIIKQGGLKLDGQPIRDEFMKLSLKPGEELILKIGKRRFLKIKSVN